MSRRKKKNQSEGLRGDEWMATFSDTVTLLLTFFILLYSFSSVDAQKFKQIASAFQSVLSGQGSNQMFDMDLKEGSAPVTGETPKPEPANGNDAGDIYSKVKEFIEKNNLQASVEIKEDSRGVIIQLRDNILFESGKADIKDDSKPILEKINSLIAAFPNNIIVEGHTDNVPINNERYATNWELSTARATAVLRYFVETKGQAPTKFTAAGYGEYKPVAPNDSDANKSMNRRVNILIVANEKKK